MAEGALEAPLAAGISSHDVILGDQLERLPGLSDVVAARGHRQLPAPRHDRPSRPGEGARLPVGRRRRPARVWTIQTTGATTRTRGGRRSSRQAPTAGSSATSGEPARTGNVVVPPARAGARAAADTDDEVTPRRTPPRTPPPRHRRTPTTTATTAAPCPGPPARSTPTTRRVHEPGEDRGAGRPGDGGRAARRHRTVERGRRLGGGREIDPSDAHVLVRLSASSGPARRPAGSSALGAGAGTARSSTASTPPPRPAPRRTRRVAG